MGVLRAQYEHAVAILIGKPPAEFSLPPLPLTVPPPHIPVSLPSELLERRPDIAAAERRVASANAQIGVAKSAYYPLINLGAAGGFESSAITTLLHGPSGLWSIGLSAVGTVFDVGRRRALTDQARRCLRLSSRLLSRERAHRISTGRRQSGGGYEFWNTRRKSRMKR